MDPGGRPGPRFFSVALPSLAFLFTLALLEVEFEEDKVFLIEGRLPENDDDIVVVEVVVPLEDDTDVKGLSDFFRLLAATPLSSLSTGNGSDDSRM